MLSLRCLRKTGPGPIVIINKHTHTHTHTHCLTGACGKKVSDILLFLLTNTHTNTHKKHTQARMVSPGLAESRSQTYISVLRHAHSILVRSGNLIKGVEDGDGGELSR